MDNWDILYPIKHNLFSSEQEDSLALGIWIE